MADGQLGTAIRRMLQMLSSRQSSGLTDGQLLERFAVGRDEAAFETLLWRHGFMVLNLCRRILRHSQDAEDAFQATFLVLCRKAHSISRQESVAGWLHRVAYRIAQRIRVQAAARAATELPIEDPPAPEPRCELVWQDLRPVLDEELNRLPEKYRTPLVLHYLEGKTVEQAAQELGWPSGTVSGRLARGRDLLRRRLIRRGIILTAGTVAGVLTENAGGGTLPPALIPATVKVAVGFVAGKVAGPGASSVRVATLAKDVLRTLLLARLKMAAALLLVAGVVALGAGTILRPRPINDWVAKESTLQDQGGQKDAQVLRDADGDPLPRGAILRLGSARFRHGGSIRAMAYSPDGRTLVTMGGGGGIRTWDATAGQPRATVSHSSLGFTNAVAFSPDAKLFACNIIDQSKRPVSQKVILARLSSDEVLHRLDVPPSNVRALAFSGDGKSVVAGGDFGFVLIWNVATGQLIRRLNVSAGPVALSPDGQLLAAIDTHWAVRLWEVATGVERPPLAPEGSWAKSLAFSKDGRVLACGYQPGKVSLWDPYSGKAIREFSLPSQDHIRDAHGRIDCLAHLAISSDGKTVATSGDDARTTVRIWDSTSGKLRAVLPRPERNNENPHTLVFSPDDKTLAVGGDLEEITLWDVATGQRIQVTKEPIMGPCVAAMSPDGKIVATGSHRRPVQLWDARTGLRIGGPIDATAHWLAFSPDGTTLVIDGELWNLGTGKMVTFVPSARFAMPSGDQKFATLSLDKHYVALSGEGLAVYETTTREQLWSHARGWTMTQPAAFSVDGKTVARSCPDSADSSPIVALYETLTGKQVGRIPCPDRCWAMAFCPDGRTVALAGTNYVQLWDVSSRTMVRQFDEEPVDGRRLELTARRPLAFSPDGRILAAASLNDTICLWNVATGRELGRLSGHGGIILSLAFAGDGQKLVSGSYDTTAMVWDLAPFVGDTDRWVRGWNPNETP